MGVVDGRATTVPPRRRRVLVTGFEPFGGADENPSARLVEWLASGGGGPAAGAAAGLEVVAEVLPVSAARLPPRLDALLESLRPDVVLGLGEARRAAVIRVERVAVNLLDFAIADNDGRVVRNAPVVPGGPPAYFATLPAAEVVEALRAAGVPCEASLSRTGAYLCNQMMYLALDRAARRARGPRVGFLHVPSLPAQDTSTPDGPAMDFSTQQRGVTAVLRWLGGSPAPEPLAT